MPCFPALCALVGVDDDGVEQAFASDVGHPAVFTLVVDAELLELLQLFPELGAHGLSALAQVLIDEDVQRCDGHSGRQSVATWEGKGRREASESPGSPSAYLDATDLTVSAAVTPWCDHVHDVLVGHHGRDGEDTAAEGFAEGDDVCFHLRVVLVAWSRGVSFIASIVLRFAH